MLQNVDIQTSSPNLATTRAYEVNESSNAIHESEYPSVSRDDQVDGVTYKDEAQETSTELPLGETNVTNNPIDESSDKDDTLGVSSKLPPGTSIPMKDNGNGINVFSPSVLQDYDVKINADYPQTPPRSSSPDIYKDESPGIYYFVFYNLERSGCVIYNIGG